MRASRAERDGGGTLEISFEVGLFLVNLRDAVGEFDDLGGGGGGEDNQGCSEVFVAPVELDWRDRQRNDGAEYADREMMEGSDMDGLEILNCEGNLLGKNSLEVVNHHERSMC